MPTVLITGCSSGFGLETAHLFLDQGWKVVAGMRKPDPGVLPRSERLCVLPLDVTDPGSVTRAIAQAGDIDVLVNNAGFGAPSPLELTSLQTARSLFETNTLGAFTLIQAVLPQFRQRGAGVVINVSSSVTLKALPVIGMYRASKAAVNALTESLALEVAPFGVRVHLVLPGRSPETRFGEHARVHMQGLDHPDYARLVQGFISSARSDAGLVTHASDVAAAVWRAATDPTCPARIPAGADAEQWMAE